MSNSSISNKVIPRSPNSQNNMSQSESNSISDLNLNQDVINSIANNNTSIAKGKKRALSDVSSTDSIEHKSKKVLKSNNTEESNNNLTHQSENNIADNNITNNNLTEQSLNNIPTSNGDSTENWLSGISRSIPEQPRIPLQYQQESVAVAGNDQPWVNHVQNTYIQAKQNAYHLIDNLEQGREFIRMYTNNYIVRIREKIPTPFARNVDYDSTFDSDSENGNNFPDLGRGNNTGLIEPQLPPVSQDGSSSHADSGEQSHADSDEQSHADSLDLGEESSSVPTESSYDSSVLSDFFHRLAIQNAQEAGEAVEPAQEAGEAVEPARVQVEDNVAVYIDPVLADNPELTVHHPAASDDDVLSPGVSSDGYPQTGQGLEPLDSGRAIHEVTYSHLYREDNHEHGNYLISFRGDDEIEYRLLYQHLTGLLDQLTALVRQYDVVLESETLLHRLHIDYGSLGTDVNADSVAIFDAANILLHIFSAIN